MKSIWRTARALERRLPALRLVQSAVPIPGTRRCRSAPSNPPRIPSFLTVQDLRTSLESQQEAHDNSRHDPTRSIRKDRPSYEKFKRLVKGVFNELLKHDNFRDLMSLGIRSAEDVQREAALFQNVIDKSLDLASRLGKTGRHDNPFFWTWRNAFVSLDIKGLRIELKHSFTSFIVRQQHSEEALAVHKRIADLRNPHEWFPATRAMQRTIHLHVGPTNSGKTYHALKALEAAQTGVYAGPLRLLAHEVYSRFKAKGRRCALITGEEQRIPEGDGHYFASCTVEMSPLNRRVDVAVIDEIQMIGDEERGWAWTQALLGLQARELHLCGEERAVPLIKSICAKIGDEVIVHKYERLSGLQPMKESLQGRFENLRKGDAVVSFSRVNLHSIKSGIEKATGKKCAIVYGALPPESRAQQAALFNDPDNDYDFLAASDAIGMGLNLEIKRVVFEAITKHDGRKVRELTLPELKQIGGRAGRYRTVAQAAQAPASSTSPASGEDLALTPKAPAPGTGQVGLVTTLEDDDLDVVHSSFEKEAEPLKTAGLFPPAFVIERFSSYFPPGTPFSFILLRLRDIARLSPIYHLCSLKGTIDMANHIQSIPLTILDRSVFLNAPMSLKDDTMKSCARALARCLTEHNTGDLLDIKELNLEILDHTTASFPLGRAEYLKKLESLHLCLTLYLWLSYRFVGVFKSQALAFHVKSMVEERINDYLANLDYSPEHRKARVQQMRKQAARKSKYHRKVFDEIGAAEAVSGQQQQQQQQ